MRQEEGDFGHWKYKEKFKREELEHELAGEEEDMLRNMTPKERKEYLKAQAESYALRYKDQY